MKILHSLLLTLFLVAPACAQFQQVPQATDAEVEAGENVKHYVNPRQYQQFMGAGGGTTNGQTAVQVSNIVDGISGVIQTNGSHTTMKFSSAGTNAIQSMTTNMNSLTVTNDATFLAGAHANTLAADAGVTSGQGYAFSASTAIRQTANVSLPQIWFTMDFTLEAGSGGGQSYYNFDNPIHAPAFVGSGSGLTSIPIAALSTNGGLNGQVATVGSDGMSHWSNAPASGGSQSPLTADVNAAGFSGTNYGDLAGTNLNFSKLTPFIAPTAFGCVGNSRASGVSGDTFTNWFYNLMTNYIPASRIAGVSNAAVSGAVQDDYLGQYTNKLRPWFNSFPAGTPKLLFVHDFYNNLGLSAQATLNSASNLIVLAHTDGVKVAFTTTPGDANPLTFELSTNKATFDYWVMTNSAIDYRIDCSTKFRYEQANTLQNDRIHYTQQGRDDIDGMVMAGLLLPQGTVQPSMEFHGVSGEFVDPGLGYSWRGFASQVRLGSHFPGVTYDSGGLGAAWLGMNASANGVWSIYMASGSGNVNGNPQLDVSMTGATFYHGVTSPGFIGSTNYFNTNSAPFVSTNGLQDFAVNTFYTNTWGARGVVYGSFVFLPAAGQAENVLIGYTNGSVGSAVPLQASSPGGSILGFTIPFSFPLSPGGYFRITPTLNSGSGWPTNTMFWAQ